MSKLPDQISIVWHIDDIKRIAPQLSKQQCREVLQLVEHDATIGVNWDTLEYWVSYYLEQTK